ncbi:MAG: gamma-glutamyltransferase [Proteobacteria bacterium]|nr:gamma-glutamyltransferase [Pseudomonadota bacterium]
MKGVVSAGHELTAKTAVEMLEMGGNAFDAAVAATFSSFVCEPALTGIGGGGFFMGHTKDNKTVVYDFFPDMPGKGGKRTDELHFYPISMDFTDTVQEFHVGKGAAAVPGSLAGLSQVYEVHCTLPLPTLLSPAISYARNGIVLNKQQAYFNSILGAILTASEEGRTIYAPHGKLLKEGERLFNPDMANTLEFLATEGLHAFYEGDWLASIVDAFGEGGFITEEDLSTYSARVRSPLEVDYHGRKVYTNPPPSSGGCLIAFSLKLLETYNLASMPHNSCAYLKLLFDVMTVTNEARGADFNHRVYDEDLVHHFLSNDTLSRYRDKVKESTQPSLMPDVSGTGNTTHLSIIDNEGNAASVTTSNGEGCGYFIPGTGIMLNNMLGEEDINPHGFHSHEPGMRLSSMMAPTIVMKDMRPELVLGSGGSNRIRNAILQVILNVIDHGLPVNEAVNAPRCHWDGETFHAEKGINKDELDDLKIHNVSIKNWSQQNMYFGGVHTAVSHNSGKLLSGAGDARRGGVCLKSDG